MEEGGKEESDRVKRNEDHEGFENAKQITVDVGFAVLFEDDFRKEKKGDPDGSESLEDQKGYSSLSLKIISVEIMRDEAHE